MKKSILILTGGGPAPGINTVVASIAKTFIAKGYRVLGIHGGFKGLFSAGPQITELDFLLADSIYNRGGSFLIMSRYKPSEEDFEKNFNIPLFVNNNIELLVTIGGDDTASTANRVAKYLSTHNHTISNIHVPKTIDNDLPLPLQRPTFGYESAKSEGARLATTIYEDARASNNWFIICAMGRSAGHLAFGIGAAAHYPMIIIPEMFNKTTITLDKIINLSVSSMIKRLTLGIKYGSVMISEGVFQELSNDELTRSGIIFSYDDHGHPELGKVSKAHIFVELVEKRLKELNINIRTRPVELGYELRCQPPVAYDLVYCTELGIGVYKLFIEGNTGCMVYIDHLGKVMPLNLVDIQDPVTGKINPRGVSIDSDRIQTIINNIFHFIKEEDYPEARKYVSNPEEFDFRKILNW